MLSVGGTQERAGGGAGGVHQTLKLQRGDDVRALVVGKLIEFVQPDGIEARRGNNRAVFADNMLVFLGIIDRASGADPGADAALAGFEHGAVVRVYGRDLRHGLRKGNVDCAAVVHAQIEGVRHLLLRAFFRAKAAAGADVLFDIARFFPDGNLKITDEPLDGLHLGIGIDVNFLILRAVHHFRRQNTGRAVERGKGFVDLGHFAADGRLFFDNIDLISRVRNVQSGLDTGDTAADDQCALDHGAGSRGQGRVQPNLGDGGPAQNDRFFRCLRPVFVNPGALLADVRDLDHEGIQTGLLAGFAEGCLVHPGGAGADNDAGQGVFADLALNQLLTRLGAHILIVGGENNARLMGQGLGDGLYIHGRGNITAAPAYENADSLHCTSSLSSVFPECAGDRLLREILVQLFRDGFRPQVVHSLTADDRQPDGLDQIRRLHAARAAFHAGKAAQAGVDAAGAHQLVYAAGLDHGDELVGVVIHLVIGRAACGAFAAAHTLAGIDTGNAPDHIQHIVHCAASFTPSASASSSVK